MGIIQFSHQMISEICIGWCITHSQSVTNHFLHILKYFLSISSSILLVKNDSSRPSILILNFLHGGLLISLCHSGNIISHAFDSVPLDSIKVGFHNYENVPRPCMYPKKALIWTWPRNHTFYSNTMTFIQQTFQTNIPTMTQVVNLK